MTAEHDWHIAIMQKLDQPSSTIITRDLKDLQLSAVNFTMEVVVASWSSLIYGGSQIRAATLHELSCGDNDVNYIRL